MERSSKLYLQDIIDCILFIEQYLVEKTKEDLFTDQQLQDAVLRRLEIIGEASRQLSETVKNDHLEVPWRDIINMRNIFVHGYFGIDIDLVWRELHEDLAKLKKQVEAIIKKV